MNKQKEAINEFINILNKAKINAYSKQSLKKPLSNSGLKDFKESIKEYYNISDEEMDKFLGAKNGKKS